MGGVLSAIAPLVAPLIQQLLTPIMQNVAQLAQNLCKEGNIPSQYLHEVQEAITKMADMTKDELKKMDQSINDLKQRVGLDNAVASTLQMFDIISVDQVKSLIPVSISIKN